MLPSQQELSNLLGILYDAASDSTLWSLFLEQLASRCRATSAALVMHDLNQATCAVGTSWRLDPESDHLYQTHYHSLDPWAKLSPAHPTGGVYHSESVFPQKEMNKTEFHNDFLVPANIEHGLFGVMENSKSRVAAVSLYRNRLHSQFDDADLQILESVLPHLQRAFKLHLQLFEVKAHSAGIESALDMLPTGLIFLGSRGEIIFMNLNAATIVGEGDGLLATKGGLSAEVPGESARLKQAIHKVASTSNGRGFSVGDTVLISRRKRPPLQVQVSPIHCSLFQSSQSIAAIAFVNDPSRLPRPRQDLLRLQYGLTPAECRIALLFSDGHAPRKIAGMVGVTENTVRSQIKSIFSKTGVRRQCELIRLLLSNAGPTIHAKRESD